jgi:DNA-binding response OmpR family regulator
VPGAPGLLPHAKAYVPVSPRPSRKANAPGSAVILCVERDPYVRDLETYFLSEAGFGVTFAEDGLQALQLARDLHPTIVITEILVPKLDGLALCRRLKSDPATQDIAVLVFSLLSAERRAHDAGADAFLSKPLSAQGLKDAVREVLTRRSGRPTPPGDASRPAEQRS